MSKFFIALKAVSRQRKLERYVENKQFFVDYVHEANYKLFDNTKSIVIYMDETEVVTYFLTVNKWTHRGKFFFGTPRDCIFWMQRQLRKKNIKNQKAL
jgi:hypothetical protein